MNTNFCEHRDIWIQRDHDNELSIDEQRQWHEHLQVCAICARAVSADRLLQQTLSMPPAYRAPEYLARRLHDHAQEIINQRRRRLPVRLAWAGALTCIFAFAAYTFINRQEETQPVTELSAPTVIEADYARFREANRLVDHTFATITFPQEHSIP